MATAMGEARREQLLGAAATLFVERGYHDVGIAEIGNAAGIVGSGVYRHFASKEALLAALTERVVDRLVAGARAIRGEAPGPAAALDRLVRFHARFALTEREMIGVYLGEERNLAPADRRRVRRRQRAYLDEWTAALGAVRPDLDAATARTTVQAAVSLLNTPAWHRPRVGTEAAEDLLCAMASRALRAPKAARASA